MHRQHLNVWILAVFSLAVTAGCAPRGGYWLPDPIPASKDPDFTTTQFTRVAALVETDDFLLRGSLEDELSEAFDIWGVPGGASYKILPPTRAWTDSLQDETLKKNGVDAVLRLRIASRRVDEYVVPPSTTTTSTTNTTTKSSSRASSGETKSSRPQSTNTETKVETTTTDGYTEKYERLQYRVELVDLRSGRVAWVGGWQLDGMHETLMERFSDRIVGQLIRDSLVTRTMR